MMNSDRADFDNVAWDRSDEAWEESQKVSRRISTLRNIEALATRLFGLTATWVSPMRIGGYNNLYRMRIEGFKDDVIVRLPQSSLDQFPSEKTLKEAASAAFVAQQTQVPTPRLHFSSPDSEVGPFMIIQYVENCHSMSHVLAMPNEKNPSEAHMLSPNIPEGILESLYLKAAVQLLQLFEPSFPRIGSLSFLDGNAFSIVGRPITQNMNNMLQLANIPRVALPPENKTYETADEWYIALAEMHVAQLVFQHNDLVLSEDDCRNKYVARHLFHELAKSGRLSTFGFLEDDWSAQAKIQGPGLCPAPSKSGPFKFWCDDLRPSNILLNEAVDIVAVIDWEFSYAAPTQFSLDPPWWLLLNVPEMWHTDIEDWTRIYNVRLDTWLRALERAEEGIDTRLNGIPLSRYMRESWATGRFWLNYSARKSWAFDTIFWKYLDERFFGKRERSLGKEEFWKARIYFLSDEQKSKMESFVQRKMQESRERILVDWEDEEVRQRLDEVLLDG